MDMKPFASLSSGLLARKGAAKPAMRPQAFGQIGASLDDLGWNDMGAPAAPVEEEHVPSSIAALTPSPRSASEHQHEIVAEPEPVVAQQQRAIVETFGEPEEEAPAPAPRPVRTAAVVPIVKRRSAPAGAKAAFTLRLDTERHFRLRLAVAVTGRSAQQLVTGALDELLQSIPEVEALAGQIPAKSVNRN
jgi:hypothetical protein